MKFPYSMLREFVETQLDANEIGDLLTMAGFELEGIEFLGDDAVLDIKVMSNRGDGLSVFGLAREVLAKDLDSEPTELFTRAASRFISEFPPESQQKNPAKVSIETDACTRYACRYFENPPNGESPDWLRNRLEKVGQRSLGLIVDLTNYVMLELGQPLHAFDFDLLEGGCIVVREAKPGETLTTLNGQDHDLRAGQMMICDAVKPVAVAGVMGGANTEVTSSTSRVLLESAHFESTSVRKTRKQLGLSTDASYRFERSVDPEGVVAAIERFTELLAYEGSEIVDAYPNPVSRGVVEVHLDRANVLLGLNVRYDLAEHYLQRLGMTVIGHGDPFSVVPPSWRPDITRSEDLVEEIGRIHGYEQIPERLPKGTTTLGGVKGIYLQDDRLREAAIRLGFSQMISHSLQALHPLDAPNSTRIGPRNPGSPETAWLRNSLLPSLCEAAGRNGARNLHLFEVGQVFSLNGSGSYSERRHIAFLSTGELVSTLRKGEAVPNADFFSLKGTLESASAESGFHLTFKASTTPDARLHPTRQAEIFAGDTQVGVLGQIHPEVAKEARLPANTILAEFDVRLAFERASRDISVFPISRNPAVGRDIALLIEKSVPYERIAGVIEDSGGEVLERQWLFDVFDGQGIPEGKHSLGIGLQFRKFGENFTDEEANRVRDRIVAALAELGGVTR